MKKLALSSAIATVLLVAGLSLYADGRGGGGGNSGEYSGGAPAPTGCNIDSACNGWQHAFQTYEASSFADCMGYPFPWTKTCPYLRPLQQVARAPATGAFAYAGGPFARAIEPSRPAAVAHVPRPAQPRTIVTTTVTRTIRAY